MEQWSCHPLRWEDLFGLNRFVDEVRRSDLDMLSLRYLLVIQLEMLKQVMTWEETLHCEQHKSEVKVIQLCLTLCDPMGYTVPGILQARKLE